VVDKTNEAKVRVYESTWPLLVAMYEEMKELAKKKPDATLGKSKVQVINRLLSDVKAILADEVMAKYLDLLVDDDLPQYSDVTLMLSQFVAAMKAFKGRYYGWDDRRGEHTWFT
jgi:hypothetical protein